MNTSSIQNREAKIAGIIREYSKWDVDRDWLFAENRSKSNIFRESFHKINDYLKDEDLALWYLAFSQSFGRKTEVMHRKMADLCTAADLPLITFETDFPRGCPYLERKDMVMKDILAIDFSKQTEEIVEDIKERYRSEKFYHGGKWCRNETFENCPFRNDCPICAWEKLMYDFHFPYRKQKRFFYYDSLCILNNSTISSFGDLFSKLNSQITDPTKRIIVIKTILEGIRGITTKTLLFLQMENIYRNRDLDYSELIFVDLHAIRVAKHVRFPYYEDYDLVTAIKKFCEKYNLTARQTDLALWEMGFLCTDAGCLRDNAKLFVFNWNNVPGSDSDQLIKFLIDECNIYWAEGAEINKIDDNRIIQIRKDENIARITLDEPEGKARLSVNNDKMLDLIVKNETEQLNVYRRCIFYDICTKRKELTGVEEKE
ncbi:MAG: hypothetical protein JW878_10555 [Methanomicrobia archaeon]|nr:hypothetical protein [Methanomicrobia archaeon]